MKTTFSYKDLGLASYLLSEGNEFKGVEIRYIARFNEFKIYAKIEGVKEDLLSLKEKYENNKLNILKEDEVKKQLIYLTGLMDRNIKNEE